MLKTSLALRQHVAKITCMPMFCLSLLFLTIVAITVVWWVDVPRMATLGHADSESGNADSAETAPLDASALGLEALEAGRDCLRVLLLLWPIFIVEFIVQFVIRDMSRPFWRHHYSGAIICLCPPLRLGARNHDMNDMIWFPSLGWQEVNEDLRERLEKLFSIPMILIALAILPILLIEYGMKEQVAAHTWLQVLLHVSMGVIWFAFAFEFIVMVSVAEKKLRYCRKHWLDLAIILLPLISFLRSLRIVRATRVARLARIQQLTRMTRLYRLRGLAMRAIRALLLLKLLNKILLISPEKQLKKMKEQLAEMEAEVDRLRNQICELDKLIGESKQEDAKAAR